MSCFRSLLSSYIYYPRNAAKSRKGGSRMVLGQLDFSSYDMHNITGDVRFASQVNHGEPRLMTPVRTRPLLNEAQIRRTPVMGLRAEARRLSYIKHRQLHRNASSVSRRSIHRGKKGWFRRKPRPQPRRSDGEQESAEPASKNWARSIIRRLSFNKLFKS